MFRRYLYGFCILYSLREYKKVEKQIKLLNILTKTLSLFKQLKKTSLATLYNLKKQKLYFEKSNKIIFHKWKNKWQNEVKQIISIVMHKGN